MTLSCITAVPSFAADLQTVQTIQGGVQFRKSNNILFKFFEETSASLDGERVQLDKGAFLTSPINERLALDFRYRSAGILKQGDFVLALIELPAKNKIIKNEAKITYTLYDESTKEHLSSFYYFDSDKKIDRYLLIVPFNLYWDIRRADLSCSIKVDKRADVVLQSVFFPEKRTYDKQIIKFRKSASVNVLSADRNKYKLEQDERWRLWNVISPVPLFKSGFTPVLSGDYPISSSFGKVREWRLSNNKLYSRDIHQGIDYPGKLGTPVLAAFSGIVVYAKMCEYYGNMIIIDHGFGLFTNYAHLDKIESIEGQRVNAGEVIGLLGKTGASTGPHLHWEARVSGLPIDPLSVADITGLLENMKKQR